MQHIIRYKTTLSVITVKKKFELMRVYIRRSEKFLKQMIFEIRYKEWTLAILEKKNSKNILGEGGQSEQKQRSC